MLKPSVMPRPVVPASTWETNVEESQVQRLSGLQMSSRPIWDV